MYEHTSSMKEQAKGFAILKGEQFSYSDRKADSSKTEVVEKFHKKPYMDASSQEQSCRSDISPLQLPTFLAN